MSENVPIDLLLTWNKWGQLIAYVLLGIGVLVVMVHLFRLFTISDKKKKYDYINAAEINMFWYGSLFLILGGVIIANGGVDEDEREIAREALKTINLAL